jgi:hypothetical protein
MKPSRAPAAKPRAPKHANGARRQAGRDTSTPPKPEQAAPRRRRIGPEDEERGQQTDDRRFNRDD